MPDDQSPFVFSGPLEPAEMIDRDAESAELRSLLEGGHFARLQGPRRYGKTTLLRRVLTEATDNGAATALVDLEGVLSLAGVVTRIERAYSQQLQGKLRTIVDRLFRAWDLGLSLAGTGFAVQLRANPRIDTESVLLHLLDLPRHIHERTGARTVIAFDEFQDLLRVEGADGILRSVIQHQRKFASYAFAGSAPSMMARLFEEPSAPLLEQAVMVSLGPLPQGAIAAYIEERFDQGRRSPGVALDLLLRFCRGHPQRTMLCAHELWRRTQRAGPADEATWFAAREAAIDHSASRLHAVWSGLPTNEQRVAMALALSPGSPGEAGVRTIVGIEKSSVHAALQRLRGRGEAIDTDAGPRLTDPVFEAWLAERARA